VEHTPSILEASIQDPLTYFCQTSLDQAIGRVACLSSHLFSKGPVFSTFAQGFLDGMLILNVNPTIKRSKLLIHWTETDTKTTCKMKR
jgi:hypothetical protein